MGVMGASKINKFGFVYDPAAKAVTEYLGSLSGYTPGDTIPDSDLLINSQIRCAIQNEDGTIDAWLNPLDWTKDINGNSVDLTALPVGKDVVQLVPKFYEKHTLRTDGKHEYYFSMQKLPGYTVHPAFWNGTNEEDYSVVAVYKAHKDAGTGKLQSISGVKATTDLRRSEFRTAAELAGGYLENLYKWEMRAKLIALEFGTFDVQNAIGRGITDVVSAAWSTYNGYNPIINEGEGDSLASGTGTVDVTVDDFPTAGLSITVQVVKWRGIENFYGHLWEFLDGVNILNHEADFASYAYLCANPANFADNTGSNYTNKGELALEDGYYDAPLANGLILPGRATGSSSTGFAAYYYTAIDSFYFSITAIDTVNNKITIAGDETGEFTAGETVYIHNSTGNDGAFTVVGAVLDGSNTVVEVSESITDTTADGVLTNGFETDWRVLVVGGDANDGSTAGFLVNAHYDSSFDYPAIGARLCRKFEK
jgi:hypothetical protein